LEVAFKGASFSENFPRFIVIQFVLFSAVYSLYFWWQLISKNLKSTLIDETNQTVHEKWTFLLISGLVPFVLFLLISILGNRSDPDWVNVSYISFFILLAGFVNKFVAQGLAGKQTAIFLSSALFNGVLIFIAVFQVYYILIPYKLPYGVSLSTFTGWEKTASQVKELVENRNIKMPDYIVSHNCSLSSALSLYIDPHPWPHSLEKESRNLWSPLNDVRTKGAIFVCPAHECGKVLESTEANFLIPLQYLGEVKTVKNGKVLRKLKLFYLKGK
jgi:hypothetical protein